MLALYPETRDAFRETLELAIAAAKWELVAGELARAFDDYDENRPAAEREAPDTFELFEAAARRIAAAHGGEIHQGWESLRATARCSAAGRMFLADGTGDVPRDLRMSRGEPMRLAAAAALEAIGDEFLVCAGLRWWAEPSLGAKSAAFDP